MQVPNNLKSHQHSVELNDHPGGKGSSQHGSNTAVILCFRSWSQGLPSGQLPAGWVHQPGTGGSIRALMSCLPAQVTEALWVWASSVVKRGQQTPLPDVRRKTRVCHAQWSPGPGHEFQVAGAAVTPPQAGRVRTTNIYCWQLCRLERLRPRCRFGHLLPITSPGRRDAQALWGLFPL